MQKNGTTFGQQLTPTQTQQSVSSSSLSPTHQFSTYSSTSSIQTESSGYASLPDSFLGAQLVTGINESLIQDTGAQESYLQDTGSREVYTKPTQASCQSDSPTVCTGALPTEQRLGEIKEKLREGLREDLRKDLREDLREDLSEYLQKNLREDLRDELKKDQKRDLEEFCTQIFHEKIESMKLESLSVSEQSFGNTPATERKPHPTPPSSKKCGSSGFSSSSGSSSSLLLESRGSQTPEGLKRSSCSDSECMKRVMLKRKPKLSNFQKANSASDAQDALSMQELVGSYRQLPGVKDDQPSMVELEKQNQTAANSQPLEAIDEDLTEVELTTIADHVDPDILSPLSVRLHKNTKHYMDMMHRFPHLSTSDKAFKMLHIWFQDITPSPQNRKLLVDEFCKLKRCRVASAIATKNYSTLK